MNDASKAQTCIDCRFCEVKPGPYASAGYRCEATGRAMTPASVLIRSCQRFEGFGRREP